MRKPKRKHKQTIAWKPASAKVWRRRVLIMFALPIAAVMCGWLSGSLTAAGAAPATPTAPSITASDPHRAGDPVGAASHEAHDSDGQHTVVRQQRATRIDLDRPRRPGPTPTATRSRTRASSSSCC